MVHEIFKPWRPIDGIPHDLWVEAIHDDMEGLRFLLRGKNPAGPTLRLSFESPVGYRNINESFRLQTWAGIEDMGRLPTLLIVEQSKWVQELLEDAGGTLQPGTLVHYAIYTPEDCVDVVTEFPPRVDWLNGD